MFKTTNFVKRCYGKGLVRNFAVRSSTLNPWTVQGTYTSHKITHADGCNMYNGNKKIMDFTSGLMVVNLGHNNPYIKEGFYQHLEMGIAYANSLFETDQREKLSERLVELTNNTGGKVFYTNGGADSNETAVFIAHEYQNQFNNTHKTKVLTFARSFHGGSTIGATLLSGDPRKAAKEPHYSLPFESIMQNPSTNDNGDGSLAQIKTLFEKNDVAAIIIEGSSGSAGCIPYPEGYLKKLERMCREKGILLICDEVMSGFGRTGTMFAYEKHGIQPDIITIAKGFTSGYVPFGGVILGKHVGEIYERKPLVHGLTYFAHPLACEIANRCIDLYTENDGELFNNVKARGKVMYTYGDKMEQNLSIVKEYRNNGLLGCVELDTNDDKLLGKISSDLMEKGVYCFRRLNMLFTAPPLIITNDELCDSMEIINDVLCENSV